MRPDEPSSGLYAYEKIAAWLRQQIYEGEFEPGSKVPGEKELMARFDVEQPTARRALEVLKNDGLIFARRGAGTYVRSRENPVLRVRPVHSAELDWMSDRLLMGSYFSAEKIDHVRFSEELTSTWVTGVLNLPHGTSVWRWERRYTVGDRTVQTAVSWYPPDVIAKAGIMPGEIDDAKMSERLAAAGCKPIKFREELTVGMPTAEEKAEFEMPPGVPVVSVDRFGYTADNGPVELTRMIFDSSRYNIEYRFIDD